MEDEKLRRWEGWTLMRQLLVYGPNYIWNGFDHIFCFLGPRLNAPEVYPPQEGAQVGYAPVELYLCRVEEKYH